MVVNDLNRERVSFPDPGSLLLRLEACRLFELLLNDRPSLNQLVILRMGTYPYPHKVRTILYGKRAVVEAYSR
jgi:hypothetical protein